MRIEFLSNHGAIGGGEVMLFQLIDAARAIGHDVSVVAPVDSEVAHNAVHLDVAFIGVDGTDRRSLLTRYAAHARQSGADLLWCNGPIPSLATMTATTPRLVHLHQVPSRGQRLLLHAARRGALATLVPSRSMSAAIPGTTPFPNWTGPTPVDDSDAPDHRSSPFEPSQPTPSRQAPLRIGFIGRLSTAKGIDVLADSVALLPDDLPIRLVVAGDDRFVPATKSGPVRASLDRISDRVDLLGWIDRERFHASVDLVVVPSIVDESFGLVAAEAMARRSPLVVTDAGALPEIVGPDFPWIAPRSNPQGLATVLQRMLDNPALVDATVEQAHRRWINEFSPAAGVARMESLLTSLR